MPPQTAAAGVDFTGQGAVIYRAHDESDIQEYVLYWGSGPDHRLQAHGPIAAVPKTGSDLNHDFAGITMPAGATHLLVYTKNQEEMTRGVSTLLAHGDPGIPAAPMIRDAASLSPVIQPGEDFIMELTVESEERPVRLDLVLQRPDGGPLMLGGPREFIAGGENTWTLRETYTMPGTAASGAYNYIRVSVLSESGRYSPAWDGPAPSVRVALVDRDAPHAGARLITPSGLGANSLTLTWNAASDDITRAAYLEYLVYQSPEANLNDVAEMESGGTPLGNFAANTVSRTVTGLEPLTRYYFNVLVRDEAGNKTPYSMINIRTPGLPGSVHVSPARVIGANVYSHRPARLDFDGNRFLCVWQGLPYTKPAAARFLNGDGIPLGNEFEATTSGHVGTFYNLARAGDRFALIWIQNRNQPGEEIKCQMLDLDGNRLGDETGIAQPAADRDMLNPVSLASNGTDFYIAWNEFKIPASSPSDYTVQGRLFKRDAVPGGPLTVFVGPRPGPAAWPTGIAAMGDDFLVLYADFGSGVFSQSISPEGNVQGSPRLVYAQAGGTAPGTLVWNGSIFVNIYVYGLDILSRVVNSDGSPGISERITGIRPGHPEAAFNGTEILAVWINYDDSGGQAIRAQRYDSAGRLNGPHFEIVDASRRRNSVQVASNGRDFIVTWVNDNDKTIEATKVELY